MTSLMACGCSLLWVRRIIRWELPSEIRCVLLSLWTTGRLPYPPSGWWRQHQGRPTRRCLVATSLSGSHHHRQPPSLLGGLPALTIASNISVRHSLRISSAPATENPPSTITVPGPRSGRLSSFTRMSGNCGARNTQSGVVDSGINGVEAFTSALVGEDYADGIDDFWQVRDRRVYFRDKSSGDVALVKTYCQFSSLIPAKSNR